MLADTFSEVPSTNENINWFEKPLRKIFVVKQAFTVAFAGNSDTAIRALKKAYDKPQETLDILTKDGQVQFIEGSNADYLVVNLTTGALYSIMDGICRHTNEAWIGQETGFRIFETARSNPDALGPRETIFTTLRIGDEHGEPENSTFSDDFEAFNP